MSGELAALKDGWLESDTYANTSTTVSTDFATSTNYINSTWYYYPNTWIGCSAVQLTLDEIKRLRAAAKRDAKLKTILEKFTHHITVKVDFK